MRMFQPKLMDLRIWEATQQVKLQAYLETVGHTDSINV
jgi:hypothetical protein